MAPPTHQVVGPSVWAAMNYTPPRGKCNYTTGIAWGVCKCQRYMLNPIKAATSFECDGCSHHASFHSMENPEENAILERWATAELALVPHNRNAESESSTGNNAAPAAKRKRLANGSAGT